MSTRTVLVVNSGSSSIKYQLVDPDAGTAIASGLVERIGESTGNVKHTFGDQTVKRELPVPDHGVGMRLVLDLCEEIGPSIHTSTGVAVGHRVVQGGSVSDAPALIDDEPELTTRTVRVLIGLLPPRGWLPRAARCGWPRRAPGPGSR